MPANLNVLLRGALVCGPPEVSDQQFPNGTTTIPLQLTATPKAAQVAAGLKVRQVSSPAAFVALSGVGATDDVTQADTVYLRVQSGNSFQVRFTCTGLGTAVLPLNGSLLFEPDAAGGHPCTLIEVMGSGTIEYFASGQQ